MYLGEGKSYYSVDDSLIIVLKLPEMITSPRNTKPYEKFLEKKFQEARRAMREYPHVIFDCTDVHTIRLAGLRLLAIALEQANVMQKRFILVNVHENVKTVLIHREGDAVFTQVKTIDEAVTIIKGGS